jgi:hypothetical protein
MRSRRGRPSNRLECLLRALLIHVLHTVCAEQQSFKGSEAELLNELPFMSVPRLAPTGARVAPPP